MTVMAFVALSVLGLPMASSLHAPAPNPELNAPPAMQAADVVEKLGERVDPNLVFQDSSGQTVRFGDFLDGEKPVVLVLAYYRCPMLCGLVLGGVSKAISQTKLDLGTDYRVVTVSIDPKESARLALDRKKTYLAPLKRTETDPGWRFLVGTPESVAAIADQVGFRYAYDKETSQYAHAAVAVVLMPNGRISRYLYGVDFPPRDFRLSLVEAAGMRVGTTFDRVMLKCFRWDPASRRYGFYLSAFMRGGAFLAFAGLAAMLAVFWRMELKRGLVS